MAIVWINIFTRFMYNYHWSLLAADLDNEQDTDFKDWKWCKMMEIKAGFKFNETGIQKQEENFFKN